MAYETIKAIPWKVILGFLAVVTLILWKVILGFLAVVTLILWYENRNQ